MPRESTPDDAKVAAEIEQLQVGQLSARLVDEEGARREQIDRSLAARHKYQSGERGREQVKLKVEKLRELIRGRIEIREKLASQHPSLANDEAMDELIGQMEGTISLGFVALREFLVRTMSGGPAGAMSSLCADESFRLKSEAQTSVEILRRQFRLRPNPEESLSRAINSGGGPVIINYGTIHGDIQQVIGTLIAAGHQEVAGHLELLAAAIESAVVLGDERRGYLEQVEFIARQAAAAAPDRKPSVVAATFQSLRARLQDVANIAQILAVAAPPIAHHFGIKLPG